MKTMHLCAALRQKSYLVHYLMLHRFEIHSALELSRTALLGCHVAASRRVSQDKESLERDNDSLNKQKVRKVVAFLKGVLGCLNVNRAAKKHAG